VRQQLSLPILDFAADLFMPLIGLVLCLALVVRASCDEVEGSGTAS
jgi:hypothetical protein